MKKFEIALAAAFLLCSIGVMRQTAFSATCARVRDDTLRLHIVANSDSEADQRVKLLVRDALLTDVAALAQGCGSKEEVAARAAAACEELAQTARRVLRENGFSYDAQAEITAMYFEQRTYGDVTLPAGDYTALRVELGTAQGHNWWCVLYPTVCLAASSEEQLAGYDADEATLVTGGERYVLRFKLEEWFQNLRDKTEK
ncbi:MAG: stage II sporulation protein R [Oscillospiraceae bacterium]|nr:stage II sporulation protein R [Oscillospiraceae bacterium]